MSCSEFIKHPKRSTDLFNATQTQIVSVANPAQKKQSKELVLTDSKNIFTRPFQPTESLQTSFMTDHVKNFMAQQKQCKQLNLTDSKNIFTYHFEPIQRL